MNSGEASVNKMSLVVTVVVLCSAATVFVSNRQRAERHQLLDELRAAQAQLKANEAAAAEYKQINFKKICCAHPPARDGDAEILRRQHAELTYRFANMRRVSGAKGFWAIWTDEAGLTTSAPIGPAAKYELDMVEPSPGHSHAIKFTLKAPFAYGKQQPDLVGLFYTGAKTPLLVMDDDGDLSPNSVPKVGLQVGPSDKAAAGSAGPQ